MAVIASLDGGDVALIVLAAFWGLLVLFLCIVLLNTFRVLESTKMLIDAIREETVPLLTEVKGSVERTNRELDRVDGMLVSAGAIVGRVEKISGLIEQAAAGPAREDHLARSGGLEGSRAIPREVEREDMRRVFWLALGLGAGAAGVVMSARFAKKQAKSVPAAVAREARGGIVELTKLFNESIAEGKRAMAEKERELRSDVR